MHFAAQCTQLYIHPRLVVSASVEPARSPLLAPCPLGNVLCRWWFWLGILNSVVGWRGQGRGVEGGWQG